MSAAPAPRSAALPAEPDAEEGETRAGQGVAAVIHLPDQSQPPPKRAVPWRGRRRVADPLSARFDVRCRPAFLERLMEDAAAAGLSLSAYVCAELGDDSRPVRRRRSTLPQIDRALLTKWLAELGKLGSNHNQLAREKNTTGAEPDPDEWRRIAAEIQDIGQMLRKALGYAD